VEVNGLSPVEVGEVDATGQGVEGMVENGVGNGVGFDEV